MKRRSLWLMIVAIVMVAATAAPGLAFHQRDPNPPAEGRLLPLHCPGAQLNSPVIAEDENGFQCELRLEETVLPEEDPDD